MCAVIDADAKSLDQLAAQPAGQHGQAGLGKGQYERYGRRVARIVAPNQPADEEEQDDDDVSATMQQPDPLRTAPGAGAPT